MTANFDALDLEPNVFTSAAEIAASLKDSAEASDRRNSSAFRSGMSMLTLYVIGPAETCPPGASRRSIAAKGKLRELFGRKG